MAGKQLTAQNATITTAAVEVKALTISGKQVTLAVFRQLKEQPLIGDDGTLNGEPWGVVNYHPDKCGDDPEHLHVVWQNGSDLRRAAVQLPDAGYHKHPAADLYVQARIIDRTIHTPYSSPTEVDTLRLGEKTGGGWRYFAAGRFTHDGMNWQGAVPARLREDWRKQREANTAEREAFEAAVTRVGISPASVGSTAQHLLSELPARQYRITVENLEGLPQLFIAV